MARFGTGKDRREFRRISVSQIARNPNQPRKIFEIEALRQLEDSIRRYGVITPLTVRKTESGYELIAGERRLRAAKMAGLENVPCYILQANEQDSSLMALIENLQRRDLDFFEEAASLRRLTQVYGLTQQQAAQRIGKTQSSVANKLRLLKLSPESVEVIRRYNLTERHARALLRLEEEHKQLDAAVHIGEHQLNVERAEKYIERQLGQPQPKQSKIYIVKDVRIFVNTIERAIETMRGSGVDADVTHKQEGEDVVVTIRIPQGYAPKESKDERQLALPMGG